MTEGLNRNWQNESRRRPRRRGFEVQEDRAHGLHPGGKAVRGSGSSRRPSRKSDSVGDIFRAEAKTTEKPGAKSIRIERSYLDKIEAEANATGLQPMLVFGFSGSPRVDWVAFPARTARFMTYAIEALLKGDLGEARDYAQMVKEEL